MWNAVNGGACSRLACCTVSGLSQRTSTGVWKKLWGYATVMAMLCAPKANVATTCLHAHMHKDL